MKPPLLSCLASLFLAGSLHSAALTQFGGMCDASAVVPLTEDLFVVADDEDNFLRVYSLSRGGQPVTCFNLSRFLGFKKNSGETDLEGAARIGDHIYWISSHGRNSKGKNQPMRQRLFVTTVSTQGKQVSLQPYGTPYSGLLNDLARAPQLKRFQLGQAALNAPKDADALNIEGLAATPEGQLLIGFRNPVPEGRALVVPLLNPTEVAQGKPAHLGDPHQLDLGGLGIRSLSRWRNRYLVVAGATGSGGPSRIFEWNRSTGAVQPIHDLPLDDLNPEAITPWPDLDSNEWLILSDDGARICDGVEAKKLKNPERKRFRALRYSVGKPTTRTDLTRP